MTAVATANRSTPAVIRFSAEGGTQITARIGISGQVVITTMVLVGRVTDRGQLELWPRRCTERVLGVVDPFNPASWYQAEAMIKRAGYRVSGDWSTVDRCPVALLRPGR